jgi:hypothetical protein
MQTQYPSGITYPFSSLPSSSSAAQHKSSHGAHLASSTRRPGKGKQVRHNSKIPKPPYKSKPKRVNQVDEHDSELVEHEEYTEQEDDPISDGDPHVDFATLAVNYHTIDTRYNTHERHSSESSDELNTPKSRTPHRK